MNKAPLSLAYPLALHYRETLPASLGQIQEPHSELDAFTERHLHCVWYDEQLRPRELSSTRGEAFRLIRNGRWNQEAGPDFLDGEWELGGRRIRGDIEIHIRPMDWQRHGHAQDPRYQQVRLHVCYEEGVLDPALLPAGCEQLSLRPALEARSYFFFDSIDVSAYPWEQEQPHSGLRDYCASLSLEQQGQLLDAAGQERLRRKSMRMQRALEAVGSTQALYQGVLRALGYRNHALELERLARQLPQHELAALARGEPEAAYAILLGVAGLLPHDPQEPGLPSWLRIRPLWDIWFPLQDRFEERLLSPADWDLRMGRPDNHPRRRLRAAAAWFAESGFLESRLSLAGMSESKRWMRESLELLQPREPHPEGRGRRLVGEARAAAILVNAIIPWLSCLQEEAFPGDLLSKLPQEALNRPARECALALFGPDHNPKLYRSTLRRQGLLQFREDFGI